MKLKFKHTIYCIAAVIGMTVLWSCEDDFNPEVGGIVDGSMTTLPVVISFEPESAVDVASRAMTAQDGLSIQNINSFWMVLYKQDGTFYKKFHIRVGGNNVYEHPGEVSNVKYNGSSDNRLPDEGHLEDKAAGRLEFDLNIPSDRYYIYGVANVKDFGSKDISTRDRLKNIECKWDSTSIANNSEMFGIFSIGQNRGATDNDPIAVTVRNNKAQQLHCWLRRLASKVTVAFDGSDLYDNVEVYIDTIMVCDVPKKCILGMPNYPGQADPNDPETRLESSKRYDVANGVYHVGGIDEVQKMTATDLLTITPQNYYHICNSSHIYGGEGSSDGADKEINVHKHSHAAKSLFFYENLQGEGKDKKQSLDGVNIWKPNPEENNLDSGWKDGKAYGTYIEVRGYYRNTAPDGSVSAGWIKYRFMLGQDEKTNYDALRNTRYKVTLKLRGFGNDYDWHIDYKEDTGIYITTPQYISYLYNKSMYATVKIVGEIQEGTKLKATILNNTDPRFTDWGPWGDNKANSEGKIEFPDPSNKKVKDENNKEWDLYLNENLHNDANGRHTSFLSLKYSNLLRLEPSSGSIQSWQLNDVDALAYLRKYYEETRQEWYREYEIEASNVPADESDGRYTLQETRKKKLENGREVIVERLYRIPLYTRSKVLVNKTGFTGNNQYVGYPRKMTVQFSARIRNEKTNAFEDVTFNLDVIQVRRIVNPKGVWRESGSTKPFEVTLMRLPEDDAPKFEEFNSVGKWSAEIMSQSDPIISLSSTAKGSGIENKLQTNVRRVEGEDEHPINFKINFNGSQSGYAIVRVRYHNYTCEHDIFCMVGKEPVQLNPEKNVWWNPTNVYRFEDDGTAVYASNPLQEGSLFRRGSLTAITPTNSTVDKVGKSIGDNQELSVLQAGSTAESKLKWSECKVGTGNSRFNKWTIANQDERIADCFEDFYSITSESSELDYPIKKAYGVLYGEGAETVAENVVDAYGYDSQTGANSIKGMRGVFVYNNNTTKTIFLPLGISGHGRRKSGVGWQPKPADDPGTMRYASRTVPNKDMTTQPMLYDISRSHGALYWCREIKSVYLKDADGNTTNQFDVRYSSSFDINYKSMGFEGFGTGAIVGSESDACFIRTVRTKAP